MEKDNEIIIIIDDASLLIPLSCEDDENVFLDDYSGKVNDVLDLGCDNDDSTSIEIDAFDSDLLTLIIDDDYEAELLERLMMDEDEFIDVEESVSNSLIIEGELFFPKNTFKSDINIGSAALKVEEKSFFSKIINFFKRKKDIN